ncbi:MAG TPA: Tol-Pal system beta propeller repeat protein TolB [Nevskiales bacterium]|nr:Tol-Pal system beta propeller repeat protein TolB [Nevskiales bacterium]
MYKLLQRLVLFGSLTWLGAANAQLNIQITKGAEGALPIAIVPFAGTAPQDIAGIVAADLQRSGRFRVPSPQSYGDRPSELAELNTATFRALPVDYVTVGRVTPSGAGYSVQFQLADAFQGQQQLGFTFNVAPQELRRVAHKIADLIYEKLTGEPGAFDTRIAYITVAGGTYSLVVADADGFNPHVVLRSTEPLMSPAWSPDGNRLAYVSFEGKRAQIVVQDVFSGARQVISSTPGINGAPSWSPDGSRLAFTLSKDGNPEIYVASAGGGGVTRLTDNPAIDTEPAWSADGRSIYFLSDRGGGPQIYRMSAGGGGAERVTYEGDYNASPALSPDGQYLAFVHRSGGFRIAVMDLRTRQTRVLTSGGLDESPSFAPNGRMIIYANGRGGLAAISVDGRVQQSLAAPGSEVREPAWSPSLR